MADVKQSKSFNYIRNQVLLGNFNADELMALFNRKIITDDERKELTILAESVSKNVRREVL